MSTSLRLPFVALLVATIALTSVNVVRGDTATCYASSGLTSAEWPGCQVLSSEFIVYWKAVSTTRLRVAAHALTARGWVALGFSENGSMRGLDSAVFRVIDGKAVLEDRFSEEFAQPRLDAKQDLTLLSSKVGDGITGTLFAFERDVDSCDHEDIPIITHHTMHVVYAYGSSYDFVYHGPSQRGAGQVAFYGEPKSHDLSSLPIATTVVTQPRFTVPAESTRYQCSSHKLPVDRKHHVVAIDPIIKSSLVHHMILYVCDKDPNRPEPFNCDEGMEGCQVYWTGWAVGGKGSVLPEDVGLEMGELTKYVMLEIHYDNPKLVNEVDVGSGFQLRYTDSLRKYDMGVLTVGAVPLELPPGKPAVEVHNECPSECTKSTLPSDGVTIFSLGFHMHLIGRKIWTQVVRDGVEVAELGRQDHYHFNYQNPAPVAPGTKIYPGDRLITHCVFNTTGRNFVTKFGESTNDEMCFNFITYYPRVDLTQCIDVAGIADGFKIALCNKDSRTVNSEEQSRSRLEGLIPYASFPSYKNRSLSCREESYIAAIGGGAGQIVSWTMTALVALAVSAVAMAF